MIIKRGMVKTALGCVFYLLNDGRTLQTNTTIANTGGITERAPILCFHMSPRSSDEYLEVLPLLASGESSIDGDDSNGGRVVIAFDIPGYGSSENPPRSCTVDEISDAFLEAADLILSDTEPNTDSSIRESTCSSRNYVTLGSLLGNYFCLSLASRYPERIKAGILTNPWYNPAASGASPSPSNASNPNSASLIQDPFELKDDGSHLIELHSKRSHYLDPELNFRVVNSEISYLVNRRTRYSKGVTIQGGNDYDIQAPIRKIVEDRKISDNTACSSFLCILGEACADQFDRIGIDGTNRFEEACNMLLGTTSSDSRIVCVERLLGDKSTLNVVNQMPEEFAALCNGFLSDHDL